MAVAACTQPRQLFQNGISIAEEVCHAGLISDSFYTCCLNKNFICKLLLCVVWMPWHSRESVAGAISLKLVIWVSQILQGWGGHQHHPPYNFDLPPSDLPLKNILLVINSNWILKLCEQQGHGSRHRAPAFSKMASTDWCSGGISVSVGGVIIWKYDFSADYDP